MHVHRTLAAKLVRLLADSLEEGQALDVAHRAADLAKDEIHIPRVGGDERLDRIGHVRDDLDRRAEIVAPPLALDHVLVDAPGRDVVALVRRHAGEAFVMTEIQVGLRAVVGHVDLAVLGRTHRAGVDVEIGVELAEPYLVAARLEERAERGRGQSFAEGRDNAAGNEDVASHRPPFALERPAPHRLARV